MENNLSNRMTRSQGRPPNMEKREPQVAIVDTTQRHVPPVVCPVCGRGMTPRVERWNPNGSAACICSLTNCRFLYTPAIVTPKG